MELIPKLKIDREFVGLLAAKRFGEAGKLIQQLGFIKMDGSCIANPHASYARIEKICYTINYLQENGLVVIPKTIYGNNKPDFDLQDVLENSGEHPYERVKYYNDLLSEYWGKELRVTFGFYDFIANGYQTAEERQNRRNFWLPIFVAILSSTLTSVLTWLLAASR